MMASFSAFGGNLPSIALIFWNGLSCVTVSPRTVSMFFSPIFVCCSGDLGVHLLLGGRGGISGFEVIWCSQPFQYFRWDRLCINTVSSIWYMFQNDGTQDLFSFLAVCWKPSFAQFVLLTISVPVCILYVEACTMGYRVDSEVHLQTNEDL